MTDNLEQPCVLLIDDKPDEERGRASAISARGLKTIVRTPQDVTLADVAQASVIAVDEYLEWGSGSHPEVPAFFPVDGLALVRVFQRHAWKMETSPAFVLRSGELAKLGESLPAAIRESALAAQHDLDWAFNKQDAREGHRIAALAAATHELRRTFPAGNGWEGGRNWLGLADTEWCDIAATQVDACRPPDHSVADYTSGSSWLRWFAQRILPYPTFLLSDLHASVRLRLPLADFQSVLASGSPLSRKINEFRYSGNLHDFNGRRWWRAGVDHFVDSLLAEGDWDVSEGELLAEKLTGLHGGSLGSLPHKHPVVAIDANYTESEWVIDSSEAVRLSPDLWPVFADEPWASIDDAEGDPHIRSLVAREDQNRIFGG
ncbi:hypothetical protein F2B00_18940 [Streptomyces parvus]|uniref:hypothetical protein n=1 Tax=Streptomyces parvus TaxID=66428 RepID=UPI0012398B84|nr:hypothetical protein [Streptomyces parvus]KAA6200709.1 hypothetical protein F2B00_18940 [Streptomyces parvus]GGS35113.1 hypothetical protein GCM10010221_37090 [Streptomyces parvus]